MCVKGSTNGGPGEAGSRLTPRLSSGRAGIAELVVDASVFVEFLLPGAREEECRELIDDPATELLVPDLVFVETANAFRKLLKENHVDPTGAGELLDDLVALPLGSFPTRSLVHPALDHFGDLTAYDACYLALAMARGCPLATFDRKLGDEARAWGVSTPLD